LLALLAETGMRVGQALGLRHADFVSRAKEVRIVPRGDNANGARAKLRLPATVPVTAGLVRCYSDYMHTEYGDLDSDYVFVNLWGGRLGAPLTYAAVHKMVDRIRVATGVEFTLYMLRHTHPTGGAAVLTPSRRRLQCPRSAVELFDLDVDEGTRLTPAASSRLCRSPSPRPPRPGLWHPPRSSRQPLQGERCAPLPSPPPPGSSW